ncbi:hypothetical protein BZZ01_18075 [Nostocales cyanobacterium HT-58-2]|nr:hypothetical protein BZZ01_18075 [Nostocales cyanobacterium HT-58-2]
MVEVNLVQLQKNLNEVEYPVSKKNLIFYAEEKGVDEGVLRMLKNLPNKQYQTQAEVRKALSEDNK